MINNEIYVACHIKTGNHFGNEQRKAQMICLVHSMGIGIKTQGSLKERINTNIFLWMINDLFINKLKVLLWIHMSIFSSDTWTIKSKFKFFGSNCAHASVFVQIIYTKAMQNGALIHIYIDKQNLYFNGVKKRRKDTFHAICRSS